MAEAAARPGVKVGDLIEIPELRTVVRLGEAENEGQAAALAREFVFTEDAVRALKLLGRAFADPTGSGFFLLGSYGSGKSHLLAVVSHWAEAGPRARITLPSDAKGAPETALFPRRL